MERWEAAIHKFLMNWKDREDVIGAMVCGSFITGNPTDRSDIDIHIILSDEVTWRERGNKLVDGFLIEYFANPQKQIRSYFSEDYINRSTMSMVQFITGKVIFDKHDMIAQLKMEASEWKDRKYDKLDASLIEIRKYSLWDTFDNLLDCFETGGKDFVFVYHQSLLQLFNDYCSFLNIEQIPFYQITRYLSDPNYLSKYLKEPFPDREFSEMYVEAIEILEQRQMIEIYEKLLNHVYQKLGGFNIDGWHVRTSIK